MPSYFLAPNPALSVNTNPPSSRPKIIAGVPSHLTVVADGVTEACLIASNALRAPSMPSSKMISSGWSILAFASASIGLRGVAISNIFMVLDVPFYMRPIVLGTQDQF